ncbi:MAG: BACON domain-containing protein [Tannerellaceae bacterium]|jgi:hypothetical protein|nr:BACON domain-containing protein [Tannerellaceae bacterium]
MKVLFNCILLFVLCASCFSCAGDTYLNVGDEEGRNELVFSNTQRSRPLTVNSNREWAISSSAPWCTCSLGGSTKTETITISVEENTTGAERECTLTIKAEDKSRTIHVVQRN